MNYGKILFIVIFLCTFTGLAGASDKDFFPYDEGRTWEYETVVEGHSDENRKVTCTSLSPIETKNGRIMVIESRIKWPATGKEETIFEYYMNDSRGLNLIGVSKQWSPNPILNLSNPQYIVYYPIKVGSSTKWEGNNFSYKRVVESLSGTLTVPSGKYKDCLIINKNYKGKTNSSSGTIWYAKNVGHVKSITTYNGKKEITQLVSYSYIEK